MVLCYGYRAEDVIRQGRVSREEIDAVKEWNRSANVPILIEEQIVGFLVSCERDVEFTKKTISAYFRIREDGKRLFNDRNLDNPDIQLQLAILDFIELPIKTADDCIVIYHKLRDTAYWKYHMECAMKVLCMTVDSALYKYPPKGLIFLFDMKGVSLMHLTRVSLGDVKIFFEYTQEALPGKLRNIHVLNSVYFLDKVMAIIKPFIKKELYQMIHFHPPSLDMNKFYEIGIEKACLPSDYGGDLPDTRTLHEENTKRLVEMQDFFDEEEKMRTSFSRKKRQ